MQEFDQIQSLWQSHSVEVKISSDEMLAQAKKEVSAIRSRSRLNILGMILSLAAIAGLMVFFDFDFWTTYVGLSIISISIAVFTYILYKEYKIIAENDFTEHPGAFLTKLKTYQLNKFTLYNKLYWFYVIALSLGFVFCFYELLYNMEFIMQLSIIGFTIFWMALSATILRRAYIKREKERLDLLIEKFQRISEQFKERQ
jgi:UDP-N-acetylmuramyl pentapeptide phosphotransferase/UDP-N-acetylglucosamine-1-phosphate transferase